MGSSLVILGLFVINPWPLFYTKGMKTWKMGNYSTNYRDPLVLIASKSHTSVCQIQLSDCIPLNKERWEMNFENHRTS